MSGAVLAPQPVRDPTLVSDVLAHLDAQVRSARSLLAVVLEQGAAIRERDVHAVVRLSGMLRGEMGRRQLLEEERARLLERSGARLGVDSGQVTLPLLCALMEPEATERATARSAELRGLLHELQREHSCNRALMQIELGFLDHLMGMLSADSARGYDPQGSAVSAPRPRPHGALHVLDLRA